MNFSHNILKSCQNQNSDTTTLQFLARSGQESCMQLCVHLFVVLFKLDPAEKFRKAYLSIWSQIAANASRLELQSAAPELWLEQASLKLKALT